MSSETSSSELQSEIRPPRLGKSFKHLESEVGFLIEWSEGNYCVFLDKAGDLDWEITSECHESMNNNLHPGEEGLVNCEAAMLESHPTKHLPTEVKMNFLIMVGKARATCFDGDGGAALVLLKRARGYLLARSQEVARKWYLDASYASVGIFVLIAALIWLFKNCLIKGIGESATMLGFGACFGAIGALVSILQRVGRAPLDPASGQSLHQKEAIGSIVTGVIAALAVQLSIRVELFAPFLKEHGTAAMVLVSLMAGISERLLPSLVGHFESLTATNHSKTPIGISAPSTAVSAPSTVALPSSVSSTTQAGEEETAA